MIKLKFIATFAQPEDLVKINDRPAELVQMIQLVKFWATQYGVTVLPPVTDQAAGTIVWEFDIPDQATWDNILAHANDNSIDIFDLGAGLRTFMESIGGTFERVVEGAAGV